MGGVTGAPADRTGKAPVRQVASTPWKRDRQSGPEMVMITPS
jgi:hypothetical protein